MRKKHNRVVDGRDVGVGQKQKYLKICHLFHIFNFKLSNLITHSLIHFHFPFSRAKTFVISKFLLTPVKAQMPLRLIHI